MTTLREIKSAVVEDCARKGSVEFAAELADFARLAESRIYYGRGSPEASDPVRVRDMEITVDVAVTAGEGALPADFLDKRHVYWMYTSPVSLNYQPPMVFWPERETAGNVPLNYTIEGSKLLVAPAISGTAKLLYFKRYAAPTDDQNNWLLDNAPGLYLHGMLIEAYRFLGDHQRSQRALASYVATVTGLNNMEMNSRFSGGRLVRRCTW